jgi:hypothetical protein
MFLAILVSLLVLGGATWSVLNQSVTGNPRRNATTSTVLLLCSGLIFVAGVTGGVLGWF